MQNFPVTDWQRLERLKTGGESERTAVLGELFTRYRAPVLGYLAGRGMSAERAEDLLQDFFLYVVRENFFAQADAARGRFRNLLLTALKRYAAKQYRAEQAQRRRPEGGFAGADIADLPDAALPAGADSPERLFVRRWAETLVRRVLDTLEHEFAGPERRAHREIFRRLVVAPILDGAAAPAQRELAAEFGLAEKEVANRLVTVRRAYQRLLRAEIATYARDAAEVDAEVRELFAQLSPP